MNNAGVGGTVLAPDVDVATLSDILKVLLLAFKNQTLFR